MWKDYEEGYSTALRDEAFLAWRETGARQKALNVVRVCRSLEVKSVLEIGCGTGAVLKMLEAMGFANVYAGIDVSFSAIQFARNSSSILFQHAFVGLAGALPFRNSAFDVAILSHVLEHLHDPIPAVREASRVAQFVVVEVPTEKVLSNFIRTKILRGPYASIAGAGHVQFWSPSSITAFLQKDCGLEIIAHNLDLISMESEIYAKKGLRLTKPLLKQALKVALPGALYSRLLTTHATYLCRSPQLQSNDSHYVKQADGGPS